MTAQGPVPPPEVDPALVAAVHRHLVERDLPAEPAPVAELVQGLAPLLAEPAAAAVVRAVLARATGLGVLDPLLADPDVSEVMVNGPGPVWVERRGVLEATTVVIDRPAAEQVIARIVAPLGRRVDRSSPMVDARLPDGSRVNAVVAPLALDGPYLTVRRFGARAVPLEAFCEGPTTALLRWAVAARCNVVVTGAAGAGKTTLLNALAAHLPFGERIITIEDAAELRLPGEHVVRLEARPATADGVGEVTIRALVRNALRMRPDRLVVGECRGAEALDMVQAMTTGHEGSLSTCHASGPEDALRRLETMSLLAEVGLPAAAVREQLASAVDLLVHVERTASGQRRLATVSEVRPDPGRGWRVCTLAVAGAVTALPTRWRQPGADPDPSWLVP